MTLPANIASDSYRFRRAGLLSLMFVAALWLVHIGGTLFDLNLVSYGIYPRRVSSIVGIALAPLIHGSFPHLVSNSLPIAVLGCALLYGYPRSAPIVVGCLYIGTGVCVWLVAREGYHIGASGLATGIMFFVFVIGAIRWDPRAIVLSMLAFFLYGSMLWGVFPTEPDVSFESHLFGAVIGVVLAILLRNKDPDLLKKRYSWEDEEQVQGVETNDDNGSRDDMQRLH